MKTENIERIKNSFNDLSERWRLLFIVNSQDCLETNITLLQEVLKQEDAIVVYITLNRPYESLLKILEKNNINTDKMFFVDCITKTFCAEQEAKDCLFLENPQNLTNIAIAIDEIVKALPSKDITLFLESMGTFLIYNNFNTVARFQHFITTKIQVLDINGIFISTKGELEPELSDYLEQNVDKLVDLSE